VTTVDVAPEVYGYLLALADDEHLMGQQHTEWIGVAPFLEEDMALASIGQDELGHAALLYVLLAGDDDRAVDALALGRDPADYRSCHLVEASGGGWAFALVRHWFHDTAEELRWGLLAGSTLTEVADLVGLVEREERYHRRHANALLDALLDVPDAAARIGEAVAELLPLAVAQFEAPAGEAAVVAAGVAARPLADLLPEWRHQVVERFGAVDWEGLATVDQGGRTRRHADFGPLMARMREVYDLDPAAVW